MAMDRRRSTVTLVGFCLAAFVVGLSDAEERPARRYWSAATYPNPQKATDLFFCGLRDPAYVCDPNGNLNPYEANVSDSAIIAVQTALRHVREQTKCSCGENVTESCDQYDVRGFTIAVALADYMDLPSADVNNEEVKEQKAREFANILREDWNFGQCKDDVVIFVSAGDKKIWTAVGTLAGTFLSPALIQSVGKAAKPLFENKEYTKGLLQMIEQYKLTLQGHEVTFDKEEPHLPLGLPLWLLIVIAVLAIVVLLVLLVVIVRCCCSSKSTYQMGRQTP